MRILVAGINYAPEVTGIAPYTTGLAEGLAQRGHTVDVWTGLPHYPQWQIASGWEGAADTTITSNHVRVRRFHHYVPASPSLWNRLLMELSFGRHIVSAHLSHPDLILAVTPTLVASAMLVARARAERIPVALIVQDLYGLGVQETGAGGGMVGTTASSTEAAVFRQADAVSVIHEHFRQTVLSMGVPDDHITVIRNWSHLGAPRAHQTLPDTTAARARFGWRDDEIVVLHTGNMGVKQGLDNVVDAARVAAARELPVRFVLVGDGNQRRHLEEIARGVGRFEIIEPLPDDEYRAALAAADLLLVNELPGVSGMSVPSKLTTYFAAGRPVLGAVDPNGVTASEIVDSGAGIVVPPGDPVALAENAHRLAADRARCAGLSARGPVYAATVLGAESAIDRYEQWCHRLASRSARVLVGTSP